MSRRAPPLRPAPDRPDNADAWVVRLGSAQGTPDDEDRFADWLAQSPAHEQDWADSKAIWDAMGALGDNAEARRILGVPGPGKRRPGFQPTRRHIWATALCGGLAAAAAAAVGPILFETSTLLETVPGEQRRVTLEDGSTVMLNTATRLKVDFSDSERRLTLDAGQAYFQVAKDAGRPFRVFVGRDEVRALGTAFDVRVEEGGARVVLEEGVVAIYREGAGSRPARADGLVTSRAAVVLKPGEQARLAAEKAIDVEIVDLRPAQAWRAGQLILIDTPLSEAVSDLNRYGGMPVILADERTAAVRISGVFHTGQPERFVEAVTAAMPVAVTARSEKGIVLSYKDETP